LKRLYIGVELIYLFCSKEEEVGIRSSVVSESFRSSNLMAPKISSGVGLCAIAWTRMLRSSNRKALVVGPIAATFALLEFFVVTVDIVGSAYVVRSKVLPVASEGFDDEAEVEQRFSSKLKYFRRVGVTNAAADGAK
jgi:hypothetical protein